MEAYEQKFVHIFDAIDKGFDFLKEIVDIFVENVDDLAIELNDDIGNLTAESEENSLEQTFKNPFDFKIHVNLSLLFADKLVMKQERYYMLG